MNAAFVAKLKDVIAARSKSGVSAKYDESVRAAVHADPYLRSLGLDFDDGASPTRLSLRSHRLTYIELDEEEADQGESEVGDEECETIEYEVHRGRFAGRSHSSDKAACQNE